MLRRIALSAALLLLPALASAQIQTSAPVASQGYVDRLVAGRSTPADVASAVANAPLATVPPGADPTGLADSALALSTEMGRTGTWGLSRLSNGTFKINGFALGGQRTWDVGSDVALTGTYPTLPGRFVRRGVISYRGVGQTRFGTFDDVFAPANDPLINGRSSTGSADTVAISPFGATSLAGASMTSLVPGTGASMATSGTNGYCLNDWTGSNKRSCWAFYGDALRKAGAGTVQGIEVDTINLGDTVPVTPNNMFTDGSTIGAWLASGGEVATANAASVALGIIKNGARWQRGVVFHDDGLVRDGNGVGEAIALGYNQKVQQYTATGTLGGSIRQNVTDTTKRTEIVQDNGGTQVLDVSGNSVFAATAAGVAARGYLSRTGTSGAFGSSYFNFYWDGAPQIYVDGAQAGTMGMRVGVPANAGAPCQPGNWSNDNSYHYDCVGPSTWRRVAHSAW